MPGRGAAAAAGFGAADLAGKCFDNEPGLGAVAYGAARLTAVSRVQAGAHMPAQAASGATCFGIGSRKVAIDFGLRF